MFKPFSLFIGYRYTRVQRENHFISFISLASVLGIALGVGVLIAVLSVMNGFNKEIRAQMLSGTPHITVGMIGETFSEWNDILKTLRSYPNIKGAAPYIASQGMLSSVQNGRVQGVMVRGIDPKHINDVYPLAAHLLEGTLANLKPGTFGILVGRSLANNFGLSLGDKVSIITPEASVTPAGILPRIKRFTVIGIFSIGDLYDDKQVFIDLKDADKLFRMQSSVTGIQLKVNDELEAPLISREVYQALNKDFGSYWVMDWTEEFGSFFKALKIQKTVMTFILLLIIAVAAFNLVSSLVMMVSDKRRDIAILRTLGASRHDIMGIFIAQGGIIGLVGTLAGVCFGLFLAANVTAWADKIQTLFNVELVSRDVYLVGFLPSDIHAVDVISIAIIALVMSFIATLYPAWRAASIKPAEVLRYE